MGHHRGPKTTTQDLIFYYDTGNEKSFAGEPTTNLSNFNIANNTFSSDTPLNITQTANSSEETFQGRLSRKVVINAGGFWNSYVYSYNTSVSSPIFTVSFKIKMSDGSNPNTIITGGYIYGSEGSFYPGPTFTYLFDGWYLGTLLYNGTSMTLTSITGFYGEGGPKTFYVADWQVEAKSHATPFVNGTRSVTQGLLDLTRNETINLSSVSFDSNAQMSFDGTDDFIDTNFSPTSINYPTIEAVVYRNTATGRYEAIIQNNVDSDDALYVFPNGTLGFWPCAGSSLSVPTGQWSYVAVSYNGTTLTFCVNGTIQVVTTTCADIMDWDFLRIGAHGSGDGERWIGKIAIAKVYNRALTSSELYQNYNAIKTRFGI
jgi:hypothetical protein